MDLQTAFSYPKQDPEWFKKLLTLFFCYIFILTIPAAVGYHIRAARLASQGESVLPEWDDFGGLYIEGLRMWLSVAAINTVVSALAMLIAAILFLFPFVGAVGLEFSGIFDEDAMSAINGLITILFSLTNVGIQSFIITFIQIFVLTSLAEFNTWQAPFEIDRLKYYFQKRLKDACILLILNIFVNLSAIVLIVLTLLIGSIVIVPYAVLIQAALAGQFIQEGKKTPDFI